MKSRLQDRVQARTHGLCVARGEPTPRLHKPPIRSAEVYCGMPAADLLSIDRSSMRGFANAVRLWALPAYEDLRNHQPQVHLMHVRACQNAHRPRPMIKIQSFAHVNHTRAHHGYFPHALSWCWNGRDGEFGRTSTLNPSGRDEARSGTVCSVVTVEIAQMGLAEGSTDGLLPGTGEGLSQ